MTSDMLDQYFLNENFSNININVNRNTNQNINTFQNEFQNINAIQTNILNKTKINEYKKREEEALAVQNKNNFIKNKKPFKELVGNLSGMAENVEKYFKLPEKLYVGDKMSKKFIIQAKKI
jgi:cytochrome c biogenesis factor